MSNPLFHCVLSCILTAGRNPSKNEPKHVNYKISNYVGLIN